MKCSLIFSITRWVCFAFVFSLCLNHITWLSLRACCLCLLCRYPLAPSHFDKLGHENKPPQCQENAKYRASFLWLCLFNQLPLISALHPLFLSFQNVMEEKSVHRQRLLLSTLLLLLRPRSLHPSAVMFLALSLSQSLSFFLPPCLFTASLFLFQSHFLHSFLALSLSPLAYLILASLFFFLSVPSPLPFSLCYSPFIYFFLFHLSSRRLQSCLFTLIKSNKVYYSPGSIVKVAQALASSTNLEGMPGHTNSEI